MALTKGRQPKQLSGTWPLGAVPSHCPLVGSVAPVTRLREPVEGLGLARQAGLGLVPLLWTAGSFPGKDTGLGALHCPLLEGSSQRRALYGEDWPDSSAWLGCGIMFWGSLTRPGLLGASHLLLLPRDLCFFSA